MIRKKKTMDGNSAAAYVSYAFTDVAAIYPITPSSNMAENVDIMASQGQKNLFGQTVRVAEMQSEAGAAGAVHGSLAAGALTTTYTASQGLLLMIPNMYKIAGELLPSVIHVSARALASHALSIFGDHSDVYACRQTGYTMLCASNVQEVMDLAAIAHLSTLKTRIPVLHFFDGFRTSHEIQKIETWDYEDLREMLDMDAVNAFRRRALNPENPVLRGSAQNPDIFFQAREAINPHYNDVVDVTVDYMNEVNKRIGTDYKPFNYYGAPDAEKVIVAMGSICDTIEETVDHMNANGEKVGLVKVRLYRPFSAKHMLEVMPDTVKKIAVMDRTKEPGALGEPLYLDVVSAVRGSQFENATIIGGRYGLGSKDTVPGDIVAVYENLDAETPLNGFTLAINDDVTHLSLDRKLGVHTTPESTTSCKFWGLGADGTVGANKNSIKIIGDNTDMYAQGYFDYDSKKSGGITVSHLRFGHDKIKATYLINSADFVACHNPSYVDKYLMVEDLKPGGTFLLNCAWNAEELDKHLPGNMKRYMAENDIKFYTIDATHIAEKIGLGGRVNTILQAAFFKLTEIIPVDQAEQLMKDAAQRSYGSKGENIVKMNHDAIEQGIAGVKQVEVPAAWKDAENIVAELEVASDRPEMVEFVKGILDPVTKQQGNTLPVSAFATTEREGGTFPQGSAAFEKRGIAVNTPSWNMDNCIQCNFCAYVCPHAVIRPFALNEEDKANAPEGMKMKTMNGIKELDFALAISVMDCTGCGSCANVCPGMRGNKALEMKPLETQLDQQKYFNYALTLDEKEEIYDRFKSSTVKGSQFKTPLLEFSGACAGCGETPYAKLVTQLYGDRMYIANATGCSSIWGGSAPSTPYTINKKGQGPAWANSLFEDNAEYGFGMLLAQEQIRERLAEKAALLADGSDVAQQAQAWLDTRADGETNAKASEDFIRALKDVQLGSDEQKAAADEIVQDANYLKKKSTWIFGGDGWAYDIGFGGLDHVIAQNEDINILVFDTEVYSNTGGQASKSTSMGAVAQFAASGKEVKKKDLAQIAMSYGYVYVASVAMGADYNQCLKAFREAESYNGPSIIIAYAPCIAHGIRGGMGISMTEEKAAVASGYWNLFRFDPRKKETGENPFMLDSKEPTENYQDFIRSEVRYTSLLRKNPEKAENLFAQAEKDAKDRYQYLLKLQNLYAVDTDEE